MEALKKESFKKENAKNDFVRDCFDMFFYYLDRFEHFIQAGLTTFDDIRFPVEYYVDLMAEDKPVFVSYIEVCGYKNIWRFLDRFPEWRKKQLPPENVAIP